MRKVIVTLLVLAVLALGYLQLRTYRLRISGLDGEIATVGRGDLTIPINALGEVQPKSRREIKAEASGEVEQVLVKAGDVVKSGDVLILIKQDDEQRSVKRAAEELRRAQTTFDRAEVVLRQRQTSAWDQAKAQLDQWVARLARAQFEKERLEVLYQQRDADEVEYIRALRSYEETVAQKASAEAALEEARIAIELAEKDVDLSRAAVETTKTTLGDAEKRLEKTKITASADGMVAQVFVKEGEVIQGGKTTITGGTVLAVLADWSQQYVRAEVDEADIGVVLDLSPPQARPGGNESVLDPIDLGTTGEVPITVSEPVKIKVEAFPDQDFGGVIERIYPEPRKQASVVTYLVDVRVTSDNRHKLMSSMQADVEFTAKSVRDAVLVPTEAIRRSPEGRLGVYLARQNEGQSQPEPEFRPCRIGLDNGVYAQIVEGLNEGDRVYTQLPQKTEKEEQQQEGQRRNAPQGG